MQQDAELPFWFVDAKFRYLRMVGTHLDNDTGDQDGDSVPASAQLKAASSLEEATEIVVTALTNKLAKQLLMSPDDLDSTKAVGRLGVDSLIAVELRNWTFRELGADVGMFEILADEPMCSLAVKIAGMSKFLPKEFGEGGGGKAEGDDNAFEAKDPINSGRLPDLY